MSELAGQTTQQLFKRWRSGDAAAGQAMAQRFSDWYYAISASRLGDANCRPPLERACQRFAQGVASVTDANKLAGWAHDIIAEELRNAGSRSQGGDFPNALTGNRTPSALIKSAKRGLSYEQIKLLGAAYDPKTDLEQVKQLAEGMGGYPLAVLDARYALKRWLRDNEGVKFTECPEKPNMDWGPLPLYEGGRMTEGNEEKAFETWMLTDLGLCKDIAEFATFALALRAGAMGDVNEPKAAAPAPAPVSAAPKAAPAKAPAPAEKSGGSNTPMIIGGVVVLLLVIGAAAFFLL